jgi:hypothetical protein
LLSGQSSTLNGKRDRPGSDKHHNVPALIVSVYQKEDPDQVEFQAES